MRKLRAASLVGLVLLTGAGLQAAAPVPPPSAMRGAELGVVTHQPPPLPVPAPLPPLQVSDWSPRGTVDDAKAPQQIRVRFNRPVVTLGEPGMLAAKDVLTIQPSVAGTTVWQSPELLVFTSDQPLPGATLFRVRLRTPVQGFDGSRLDKPLDWTFQTARLHIEKADGLNLAPWEPVKLTFNQNVDVGALQVATRILAAGRPVPFGVSTKGPRFNNTLSDDDESEEGRHHLWLVPQPTWPLNTSLDVHVSPNLRPAVGTLPLGHSWHARIGTAAAPAIEKVTCNAGDGRIEVELNTQLGTGEGQALITTPALSVHAQNPRTLVAQGRPGLRYTIALSPSARDAFDQAPRKQSPRVVTCAYPRPGLALWSPGGTFAPDQAPVVGARSRGLHAVKIRTALLDEQALLNHPELGTLVAGDLRAQTVPTDLAWQERVLGLQPSGPTLFAGTPIDLTPLLQGARLPVLVDLQPQHEGAPKRPDEEGRFRGLRTAVYQKTDLAVAALISEVHEIVQVVRMDTGQPVVGAQVKALDTGRAINLGLTDANGIQNGILVQSPFALRTQRPLLMVTSPDGQDHAVTALAPRYGWEKARQVPAAREGVRLRPFETVTGTLVLDRDVFLPGEKVRFVGWLEISSPYEASGVRSVPGGSQVDISLDGPAAAPLRQTFITSADGKIWGEFTLPKETRLGRYSLNASLRAHCSPSADEDPAQVDENEQQSCAWRTRLRPARLAVKDFRNSEFFVQAQGDPSVAPGQPLKLNLTARYHHGAPVPMRSARATVQCRTDNTWRPAGVRTPASWRIQDDDEDDRHEFWHVGRTDKRTTTSTATLKLDPVQAARGSAVTTLPVKPAGAHLPSRCEVDIAVQDASLREESTHLDVLVHPSPVYLGLRVDEREPGHPAQIRVRAFSPAGQRTAQPEVQVTLHDVERDKQVGRWTVDAPASGEDALVTTPPLRHGLYVVEASTAGHTGSGRERIYVYRSDRDEDDQKPEQLHVTAESSGPRARVTITGPTGDMHGVLVVKTAGLPRVVPFRLRGGQAKLELEVAPAWAPRVGFHALVFQPPGTQGTIQLLEGQAELRVPLDDRRLNVTVAAPATAKPGDTVDVAVTAREPDGRPAVGRVSLWAVDEAVLGLTHYAPPDLARAQAPVDMVSWSLHTPLRHLLTAYAAEATDSFGPLTHVDSRHGNGTAGLAGRQRRDQPESAPTRQFFETTPLFLGDAPLDADGRSRVSFKLPHNLTSYRITAIVSAPLVGAAPARFGLGTAQVTANLPLQVRPTLPRHLRPGDEAELSVLLDNLTDVESRVEVRLENDAHLMLLGPATAATNLVAQGQQRIGFRVRATSAGVARLKFSARNHAGHSDSVEAGIPVEPEPLHLERVAVHGTSDADAALAVPVRLPAHAQHATVELALSSSLLGSLDGAVKDLLTYPHACLEQTASRLVPLLLLPELAAPHLPPGQTVKEAVAQLVRRLHQLRIDRWSGFAAWPGQTERSIFSAYAMLTLVLAHKAGFGDGQATELAQDATFDVQRLSKDDLCAANLDECAVSLLAAAEAHELDLGNTSGLEAFKILNAVFDRRWDSLAPQVQALVLLAQSRLQPRDSQVARRAADLAARTSELGATAHVNLPSDWVSPLFFSRESVDAVVLWALVRTTPRHPIVAKLVRGLMDTRTGPAWATTQENAFALLALAEYAKQFEATQPDFTAHSWVGPTPMPDVDFVNRQEGPHRFSSPVTAPLDVTLQRMGRGRLYYSVALSYLDDATATVARGLSVQRQLRPVDATIHAGDLVALDIVLRNATPLRQVVVDVPLPAGMDAVDLDLSSQAGALPLHGPRCPWFTHQELHAQRALLFADALPAGQHRHTLFLRALAPGRYAMPAAHAQAMYAPDINGRTDALDIRIEPPR